MRQFLPTEDRIITVAFHERNNDREICKRLAAAGFYRSSDVIRKRRHTLGLRNWQQEKPQPIEKPLSGDCLFKLAMLEAIRAGNERAIVGVVKDRRPWSLKRIQSVRSSGCTSPAAACTEG